MEYRHATIIIADGTSLRRVPIGPISDGSRVIDMVYDTSGGAWNTGTITPVPQPRPHAQYGKFLILIACALSTYHTAGPAGLAGLGLVYLVVDHHWRSASGTAKRNT
jgi:hypothetical protein